MKKKRKTYSKKKSKFSPGILVLENGQVFKGIGLGYEGLATGEVCFNTSITGYQEIISDPSYSGQIINFTFPHIGNVGTNKEDHESDKIWTKGVIFNAEITNPSNYRALKNLDIWLKKNKIVGLTGIDTRNLTNFIRDKGAPKGTIETNRNGKFNIKKLLNKSIRWHGLNGLDLAKNVSTRYKYNWNNLKTWKKGIGFEKSKKNIFNIVAIDYGIKKNILRYFSNHNCKITVVPCDTSADNISKLNPDGVFLSNGPGDPAATSKIVNSTIKQILIKKIPVFGICLGHQLLAHALKCKTKKMHQGHRGANHPVKNIKTSKVEITSQNHGFEVIRKSIPKDVEVTHLSLFDNSIEGISYKKSIAFSVQYHPEASPGPHDSNYLFNQFINLIKQNAKKN